VSLVQEKLQPLKGTIQKNANELKLDQKLVSAIIWQESKANPQAIRFELIYYNNTGRIYLPQVFAQKNNITLQTEYTLQCFSFGPMQIMGAIARKLGFAESLVKLLSADLGIYWGCQLLSSIAKSHSSIEDIIATYNHGSPTKDGNGQYIVQAYVDSVMTVYKCC
jgi:soluble lytic murein transglycosylase-like protein